MAMVVPAGAGPAYAASNPVVVGGYATDAFGFVGSTKVTLYAYPPDSVEQTINVGDAYPRAVVGSATTNSSGYYSISISNWPGILNSEDQNNIVNLELLAFSPAGLSEAATIDFSRQVVTQSDGSLALAVSDPDGNGGGVDLTPQPGDLAMEYWPRPQVAGCGIEHLIQNFGGKTVRVGAGMTKNGGNISFVYGKGETSQLGVAVAKSGGGWQASGSIDKSSTDTQDWGNPVHTSTFFRTEFAYGKFSVECYGNKVHARWWRGGATKADGSSLEFTPIASNCVAEGPNDTYTKYRQVQMKFTKGADLSSAIGIDLSAQTGWSTSAELKMKQPSSSPTGQFKLCGSHGPPAHDPKRLEITG